MEMKKELDAARKRWEPLTFYQRFEDAVIFILTALIAVVIVFALWNLALKIVIGVIAAGNFDPTDFTVFQALFGSFFTVIIALEFKKSILVVAERRDSIVQVRAVVLIALLAALRKMILLEPGKTDAAYLAGLAMVILALGAVYWLVRDQDEKELRRREGK